MKHQLLLSPFFLCACLLISSGLIAQSRDSLAYYSGLVESPKSALEFQRAYRFFEHLETKAEVAQDTALQVYGLLHLGSLAQKGAAYTDSEQYFVEALSLLQGVGDVGYRNRLRNSAYNGLGMLYRSYYHPEKALHLYRTSLLDAQTARDSAKLYNNMANVYKDAGDYAQAKKTLLQGMALLERAQDSATVALVYDNLGSIKAALKEPDAPFYMQTGLRMKQALGDSLRVFSSYRNLSAYFNAVSKDSSTFYALKALEVAELLDRLSYKKEAYEQLMQLDPAVYFSAYKEVADSLKIFEHSMSNGYAMMRYEKADAERQLAARNLELEKEKRLRGFYGILGVGLFVLALGIFIILRLRYKKQQLEAVYNTESRISKKVHDEVANSVYHIMMKLQGQHPVTEELLDDLDAIYYKTRDISREHAAFDPLVDFEIVLQDLLANYQDASVHIVVRGLSKVPWQAVPLLHRTTLYRVLQELMTNMRKHSKATLCALHFEYEGSTLFVHYTDNGVGCELKKEGGLLNTENRIRSIRGKLIFDTAPLKGFKVKIEV